MNLQKVRIVEMRNAARVLMNNMRWAQSSHHSTGTWSPDGSYELSGWGVPGRNPLGDTCVGSKSDSVLSSDLKAICSALRCFIKREKYDSRDLKCIKDAMNQSVDDVYPASDAIDQESAMHLCAEVKLIRLIAQDLIRFTHLAGDQSDFIKNCPISICPECDGIFLVEKIGQKYCSTKCRQQQWYAQNSQVYYSKDERAKRQRIRKRRLARKSKAK